MSTKRLLDPRWHWIRSAAERIYAELDPDATVLSLALNVDSGGDTLAYAMVRGDNEIARAVVTDPTGLADMARAAMVDATPDMEDL